MHNSLQAKLVPNVLMPNYKKNGVRTVVSKRSFYTVDHSSAIQGDLFHGRFYMFNFQIVEKMPKGTDNRDGAK